MNMVSISGKKLCKSYNSYLVFKDVSIDLSDGDVLAVIGPSGSGKPRLLKIFGLIMKPVSGELYLDHLEVTRLNESRLSNLRRKYIGYSFQEPIFIPSLNVIENILIPFYPYLRRDELSKTKDSSLKILDRLGLSGLDRRRPSDLSTGQRKRVDLARALIKDPKILIVDEPTANLDEESAEIIREVIKEARDEDKIVIFAAHRDEKLFKIADKKIDITKYK